MIKSNIARDALERWLSQSVDILNNELNSTFSYLGEQAVTKIRDRSGSDSWYDQTGNLRSSIGYMVLNDGRKLIESAFKIVAGPNATQESNGTQGAEKGRRYLEELSKSYSDSYALCVVAGMDYASYVESMDNKDVLASTKLWVDSVFEGFIKKSVERALKKINAIEL